MSKTINIWSGDAAHYDAFRPQAPTVIMDILTQLTRIHPPQLVVDLGCGTGLSTRMWAERAERIIGIEPNADMRQQAEITTAKLPDVKNITYQDGLSTQTHLPSNSADIVTVSQALHWMEPEPTFAEIARILRPGGIFAAYDYDLPLTTHWETEQSENNVGVRFRELRSARGLDDGVQSWSKEKHLERMQASNLFRFTKEITMHSVEYGNADRLIGLVLSWGALRYFSQGVAEQELGIDQLKEVAHRVIGEEAIPWYLSYRMLVGVK